jgi:hypothetical protein
MPPEGIQGQLNRAVDGPRSTLCWAAVRDELPIEARWMWRPSLEPEGRIRRSALSLALGAQQGTGTSPLRTMCPDFC